MTAVREHTASGGTALLPGPRDVPAIAAALEGAPAERIVSWAAELFGPGLTLAASFQDCVLIDVASRVAPQVEIVFLDTQYHFPQTLAYVETVRRRYDLNLRVVRPRVAGDDRWVRDPDGCCAVRKVEPLTRALDGRAAWMSGLRRVETLARSRAPAVVWDEGRRMVKVNPLVAWNDDDVRAYVEGHDLPQHPLAGQGFRSIGCWPCTRAVQPEQSQRDGRWAGSDKTECGLHL